MQSPLMPPADLIEQPQREVSDSAPRFCSRCGSPRDAAELECSHCASGAVTTESQLKEQFRLDIGSLRSSLFLYFALLGVSAAAMIWYKAAGRLPSAMSEFVTSAAFSVPVVAWCLFALKPILQLLKARFHAGWLLAAVSLSLATYLLATGAVNLLVWLGVEKLEYLSVLSDDGFGFGWAVLLICVQPAIFEELAFRGIIQGSLERFLGAREALIVSALMFGILHLSILSLPHLLVMGLVLGWLRLKTGSLLPGMALHFSHNFLVIVDEQVGGFWLW